MPHKLCNICKTIKDLDDFPPHNKTKDKRQTYCKACRLLMNAKARRQKGIIPWEEYKKKISANKEETRLREKKKRLERTHKRKIEFMELLGGKCSRCGVEPSSQWPLCMFEFHHINGKDKDKDKNISTLLYWGKERALRELKKCQLVCANCHKAIHYDKI